MHIRAHVREARRDTGQVILCQIASRSVEDRHHAANRIMRRTVIGAAVSKLAMH